MVNLTRIYTRTGDHGRTRLVNMAVTEKTDLRVAAYGDIDEANSAIGVALAAGDLPEQVRAVLGHIQNELFDVGADLGNPLAETYEFEPLRITAESITRLEHWCDEFNAALPKLRSFILPGGTVGAAQLHVARTVIRRAERTGWQAAALYGTQSDGGVSLLALGYLNRLSDLLFILSRVANPPGSEVLWVPGGDRHPDHPPTQVDQPDDHQN